ncbi:hypothetical protein VC83_03914 [Pseudogymnoascus destructans]|uniref:Phosphoribulokinase/uridine kinase domain-containing protein n=2 Tax=Pseudogymnoascus destructans TaxID=655981 RepID=L8FVW7_PSED2|nr:uncharacterized protein VC83_03914 [Pseudogymnoascus destructans]ELR04593.1 hypothetical protein GMDG_06875 [Pseudogymnoascus destructans 20631-21]OAF59485.1 hypothetical protein VC83_03914 [Pseudogymnoascus destructans]
MEEQITRLVDKLQNKVSELPPDSRYLVAISGIPGSGKTTLALAITGRLNDSHASSHPSSPPLAVYVPMDGFHLTRAQLSAMPNAAEAHQRRGAPWTFDPQKLLDFVLAMKDPSRGTVFGPSFDHALKDPVEGDVRVDESARVVVLEGLYLSLRGGVWGEVGAEMDERWFVDVEREMATGRVVERHVRSGVCGSRGEAVERATGSDALNAEEILGGRGEVEEVIRSVQDEAWAGLNVDDDE